MTTLSLITNIFKCNEDDIKDLEPLKKGMTNDSYIFTIDDTRYIVRVPGKGTENLINRTNEYISYAQIRFKDISDNIVYIDPTSGVKITKYIDNARTCDIDEIGEVKACMQFLKKFHNMKLVVPHKFDLSERINYYEKLRNSDSKYSDYNIVKKKINKLLQYVNSLDKEECLTHIDSVADNFLIEPNGQIRLIDWEYSAMQDPHLDIAMFAVYANYSKSQIDKLMSFYFDANVDEQTKYKIYAYVAIAGFLWSNWCEYKSQLGVNFGDYALDQYNFARLYSDIVLEYLEQKVESAIILAAGIGKRLQPYTNTIPKALLKVNGQPMIESCIEALHKQNIYDITIVVGYLSERFVYLKEKYCVNLVYNPDFETTNNISSLYYVRKKLVNRNVIILDADQIITNHKIIRTSIRKSGYSCCLVTNCNEWLLSVSDDGQILSCAKGSLGPIDITKPSLFELKSLSYWTKADSTKLSMLLELEYAQNKNTKVYWDDIPMFLHFNRFALYAYVVESKSIIEIDTVSELKSIDSSYK